jgi:hypothetical protein
LYTIFNCLKAVASRHKREATSQEIEDIYAELLEKYKTIHENDEESSPKEASAADKKLQKDFEKKLAKIGVRIPKTQKEIEKVNPNSPFGRFQKKHDFITTEKLR